MYDLNQILQLHKYAIPDDSQYTWVALALAGIVKTDYLDLGTLCY